MSEPERRKEAFHRVVKILDSFKEDGLFQMDLQDEECLAAIRHWTQEKRADPSFVERRFNNNYRIQNVYNKLKVIQAACRQVPMGVPINAILAGSTDPYYGIRNVNASSPSKSEDKTKITKNEEPINNNEEHVQNREDGEILDQDTDKDVQPVVETKITSKTMNEPASSSLLNLNLTWQNIMAWWSVQILFVAAFLQYVK
uniref:Uncharacterized protein n=1 Tax=Aplanochytrium stocchinoi TaxID=215587 RepID=A0A7S3V077_9STRA|mmetsp:Transcript_4180/g.5240  ORF Transcript_4180/g.5240 Transcript_4180/m.5240 type:complete len:200 (+) Transcript_4180:218-817(+)|eukprot:CAMPEP_0204839180 /NCGR_PEP_ID=MMETSP1346-20131115/33457_1 /ASSEMBLY_ACC=CAM_ASM_000771 /TAXON_ID=215587 /ORGANISM="Aplanochytrium stocchinoi, Strain GSBS06" /LENGTH=199 /DNA_ID=CAMNT_0051975749 /DNA_START=183 /DNA_END=782 /DNA_ORIENTATION=+